jgi:dTDP-4-dehydrorhamnose reductase
MKRKVLVLGANGMAGHVITLGLKEDINNFEVISIARSKSSIDLTYILDITNFKELDNIISNENPDVIINCVGLLNNTAEEYPDKAVLVNAYLPHFLEAKTKKNRIKVIHISTDCVFSGNEGNYTESSIKNGIGYYAQSKAIGEIINTKDLTFRTSIIGPDINPNGIGLFNWFYKQHGEIPGYTNAFWTGVTTIELLSAIKIAIKEDLSGLYHLVNNEKISKFQLLKLMNLEFSKNNIILSNEKYKVDKSLLNTRNDFNFIVKDYNIMLKEMNDWMQQHIYLYNHYYKIDF